MREGALQAKTDNDKGKDINRQNKTIYKEEQH